MSYASILELGSCIQDPDEIHATCHSAEIKENDKYLDPVNYWLGTWGKLIVLAAIKVQADHQEIDPENDIQKLDWDRIRQEIHQRIPQKLNGILGGSACHDWFKNRVLAYQRQFPDNKLHKKSVIQQLFQHYSDHLAVLQKSGSRSPVNLYWERWHEQLPSGLLTINKKQPQKVSLDLSHVKELVAARSKVDESKENNNGNGPYNELDNHDQGFKSEGSVEQVPASGKAVVEINAKTRLLKPNALAMKRTLPEDENMTTVGPEFKRQKIDELEKNKAQLLSVLWTFIFSHGFLYGVSQEVKKLQGDAWSCEHTLDKIEEKILNFEVTDLNVLMSSIRCLVAIYVSLTNERNLNEKVSLILDKLRKSTVVFRSCGSENGPV